MKNEWEWFTNHIGEKSESIWYGVEPSTQKLLSESAMEFIIRCEANQPGWTFKIDKPRIRSGPTSPNLVGIYRKPKL